jgi:hypothetical protein
MKCFFNTLLLLLFLATGAHAQLGTLPYSGNSGVAAVPTWLPLQLGSGGYQTGMTISSDNTYAIRTDTDATSAWNGSAIAPNGATGTWQQLVTINSMIGAEGNPAGQGLDDGVYEIQLAYSDHTKAYMQTVYNLPNYATTSTFYYTSNCCGPSTTWTNVPVGQTITVTSISSALFTNSGTNNLTAGMSISFNGSAYYVLSTNLTSTTFEVSSNGQLPANTFSTYSGPVYPVIEGDCGTSNDNYRGRSQKMAVDPQTPATAYAGTPNNGLYLTTNSGGTWTQVSTSSVPLPTSNLSNGTCPGYSGMVMDMSHDLYVYSYGNGVYFYNGSTWSKLTAGSPPADVLGAFVDYKTGYYWVIEGNGVQSPTGNLFVWNGSTWTKTIAGNVAVAAADPNNSGHVVAIDQNGNPNETFNSGSSWSGFATANQSITPSSFNYYSVWRSYTNDVGWWTLQGAFQPVQMFFDRSVANQLHLAANGDFWTSTPWASGTVAYVNDTTDSVTAGTGSKTWANVGTGFGFANGQAVAAISGSITMYGTVTAYSGGSLTVNVTTLVGSGTASNWQISTQVEWNSQGRGLEQIVPNDIIVPQSSTEVAGFWDFGITRLTRNGTPYPTSTSIWPGISSGDIANAWSTAYCSSNHAYMVTNSTDYNLGPTSNWGSSSSNYGASWTVFANPVPNATSFIGGNAACATPDNIFYAVSGFQPYYTTNFTTSQTWNAVVAPDVFNVDNISSGSYTSSTGAVTLTMANNVTGSVGDTAAIQNLTATGTGSANVGQLQINATATSGTTGTTFNFTGPTGLGNMTITGGQINGWASVFRHQTFGNTQQNVCADRGTPGVFYILYTPPAGGSTATLYYSNNSGATWASGGTVTTSLGNDLALDCTPGITGDVWIDEGSGANCCNQGPYQSTASGVTHITNANTASPTVTKLTTVPGAIFSGSIGFGPIRPGNTCCGGSGYPEILYGGGWVVFSSTSSVNVGSLGNVTFNIGTGLTIMALSGVAMSSPFNTNAFGSVVSYNPTTGNLVVNVSRAGANSSYTTWNISIYGTWSSDDEGASWQQAGAPMAAGGSFAGVQTISGDPSLWGQISLGHGGSGYEICGASCNLH